MKTSEDSAAVVTDPSDGPWGYRVCRCGVCGYTAKCTPRDDFYQRKPERFFRCEVCVMSDSGRPS